MKQLTLTSGDVLQTIAEFAECNITDLAAPQLVHGFDVERFQHNDVKTLGQVVGQFEEPVTPLVGNSFMPAVEDVVRFSAVMTTLPLAGKLSVCLANLIQARLKPFGRFDFFPGRQREKGFQTAVCPNDGVTQSGGALSLIVYAEIDKQLAKLIALDGDGLDLTKNFAALAELKNELAQPQFVAANQFPTSLLERERFVQLHFTEGWTAKLLANLPSLVLEEKLIASINTLAHILDGLRSKQSEVRKAGALAHLRDVLLHGVHLDVLARQLEITPMKGNTVIPNQTSNINPLLKMLILFVCVQLEFERLHWLLSGIPGQLVDQRWRSCFRRFPHKADEASSMFLPICGIGHILFPYMHCMLLHAICME